MIILLIFFYFPTLNQSTVNGLITLMSRRKELVQTKKRRLLLDFNDKHEQLLTQNIKTLAEELKQLNEHCLNPHVLKLQSTVIA